MFHLDYLSCFLTVLATILLTRKSWIGLLIAIVNSLIVCAIGLRTSQLGFIPANLFCICTYAFSMRSWRLREQTHTNQDQARHQESGATVAAVKSRTFALKERTKFIAEFVRGLNAKETTTKTRVPPKTSCCLRLR